MFLAGAMVTVFKYKTQPHLIQNSSLGRNLYKARQHLEPQQTCLELSQFQAPVGFLLGIGLLFITDLKQMLMWRVRMRGLSFDISGSNIYVREFVSPTDTITSVDSTKII